MLLYVKRIFYTVTHRPGHDIAVRLDALLGHQVCDSVEEGGHLRDGLNVVVLFAHALGILGLEHVIPRLFLGEFEWFGLGGFGFEVSSRSDCATGWAEFA